MHYVMQAFLVLASGLAAFFLFVTALDASVVRVVGSPEPIKKTLADSGLYDTVISSILQQIEQDASGSGEVAFGSQIVIDAADSTLSGEYLETTVSGVLDGIYRWLDGSVPVPDFKIDLAEKKEEFAKKVADGVKKHVAALPVCKTASSSEFDAFSAKCRPANLSASQAAAEVRKQILKSSEFLEDTAITADDLKAAGSDKPYFTEQLKDVPAAYQRFKASPLALGIMAFLALATVILLSSPKLVGLRNAGFILISGGVFLVLLALAINEMVDNKILSQIDLENPVFEQDLRQLLSSIVKRLSNTLLAFGSGYGLLGGISIGSYYFMKHRRSTPAVIKAANKKGA